MFLCRILIQFSLFLFTGQFRAVRDISIAPLQASDQDQILKMMDEEDGVMLVRKRKAIIRKPTLETVGSEEIET